MQITNGEKRINCTQGAKTRRGGETGGRQGPAMAVVTIIYERNHSYDILRLRLHLSKMFYNTCLTMPAAVGSEKGRAEGEGGVCGWVVCGRKCVLYVHASVSCVWPSYTT